MGPAAEHSSRDGCDIPLSLSTAQGSRPAVPQLDEPVLHGFQVSFENSLLCYCFIILSLKSDVLKKIYLAYVHFRAKNADCMCDMHTNCCLSQKIIVMNGIEGLGSKIKSDTTLCQNH